MVGGRDPRRSERARGRGRGIRMAAATLGAKVKTIEGGTDATTTWQTDLQDLTASHSWDLIVTDTSYVLDQLKAVAQQNPHQEYILLDQQLNLPNVVSVTYLQNDGAFLAGVLATMSSPGTRKRTPSLVGGWQRRHRRRAEHPGHQRLRRRVQKGSGRHRSSDESTGFVRRKLCRRADRLQPSRGNVLQRRGRRLRRRRRCRPGAVQGIEGDEQILDRRRLEPEDNIEPKTFSPAI